MKVTITIEATAQEMRETLGLPPIQPLQEEIIALLRDSLHKNAVNLDTLMLLKPLLPIPLQSLDVLQKAFWESLNTSAVKSHTTE